MEFAIPILGGIENTSNFYPDSSEFTYWKMRENRTFVIDYEIEENYMLMDLSRIIIQMNMEEKDIPKEDLKPIYLYIHSYGGDVPQAFFFADLCMSSRIPIVTIAMGVAMSSGFLIFLAGHKRYAFPHSQLLVHSGYAGFQGTAEQVEEAQKNYKKQLAEMKTYILARTQIDEKTFNKNKAKDWYLTAEELEKYAVIDKFITDFSDILN